jgi:hypothetical protein
VKTSTPVLLTVQQPGEKNGFLAVLAQEHFFYKKSYGQPDERRAFYPDQVNGMAGRTTGIFYIGYSLFPFPGSTLRFRFTGHSAQSGF